VTFNFPFSFGSFLLGTVFFVELFVDDAGGGELNSSYLVFFLFLLNVPAGGGGGWRIGICMLSSEGVELRPVADMLFRGILLLSARSAFN
jgi:hypothetical protein